MHTRVNNYIDHREVEKHCFYIALSGYNTLNSILSGSRVSDLTKYTDGILNNGKMVYILINVKMGFILDLLPNPIIAVIFNSSKSSSLICVFNIFFWLPNTHHRPFLYDVKHFLCTTPEKREETSFKNRSSCFYCVFTFLLSIFAPKKRQIDM